MKKRLILIDSNSVLHRAYHALPPLTTKKGKPVGAVYGFCLVFLKVIKEFQPEFITACFDFPAPTFRHKKFKEYKAKRPPTPADFPPQISITKEVLKAFNVPVFEKKGFEADDLIATISFLATKDPQLEVIILTGDLDILQLINPQVKVYLLKKGVKETILYDEKTLKEKYGFSSKLFSDFKALRGDPSDNIPGVPGIGEKTAAKLIKEFGSLEELYKRIKEGNIQTINEKFKKILLDSEKEAFLSKNLILLKKDIPLKFDLEKCRWGDYDKEKVKSILESLEFYSLVKRLFKNQKKTNPSEKKISQKENLTLFNL